MSDPNYKELYEQALFHLRCVSGSRNSFTPEASSALCALPEGALWRQPQVEEMHQAAVTFLRKYDK
jgi:hypothetical protein